MAHQAETQTPARSPLSADHARRKKIILLCSEELRFVACGLEDALTARGWSVRTEYGKDARPWIQQRPVERPSLRVLCIPGTVDRELAETLRTAYAPEADADLQILGVDDARGVGLVQEIERLAGVRTPKRRPLSAPPRLSHTTLVEAAVPVQRSWTMGVAAAALAAFGLVMGGSLLLDEDSSSRVASLPTAGLSTAITQPSAPVTVDDPIQSRADETVFSNVQPYAFEDAYELDPLPEEEEEIIILDDEPAAITTSVTKADLGGLTSPLAAEAPAVPEPLAIAEATATDDDASKSGLELPSGFLPVAGISVAEPTLPTGFLPVAGLAVRPGSDPVSISVTSPGVAVSTVDPFAASSDVADVTVAVPRGPTTHDPFTSP